MARSATSLLLGVDLLLSVERLTGLVSVKTGPHRMVCGQWSSSLEVVAGFFGGRTEGEAEGKLRGKKLGDDGCR